MMSNQYDNLAESYDSISKSTLGTDDSIRLKRSIVDGAHLTDLKAWNVLDFGCGTGVHAKYLIDTHPEVASLKAIDISESIIQLARQKNASPKIEYIVADMNHVPFKDNSFDYIFSRYSIHYSDNLRTTFNEIVRVLKSGGLVHLRVTHPVFSLFLKKDRNYSTKEEVAFAVQEQDIKVIHPTFTVEEYVNAIIGAKLTILEMGEHTGQASRIQGYTVPTVLSFLLKKL